MSKVDLSRRQFIYLSSFGIAAYVLSACTPIDTSLHPSSDQSNPETSAGWQKYDGNPVLGGELGTCFDVSLLHEDDIYRMWFSWRPKLSIALVESTDGIHWNQPRIVLEPVESSWESNVNRPIVIKIASDYHMWYTGQDDNRSCIGYAISSDGVLWERKSRDPVLIPEINWEGSATMCPHVIYDESLHEYHMWYSAGENYEPNAIGYATSPDGINWQKYINNPIFQHGELDWEKDRVTGAQVIQEKDWYYMFYIGFHDVNTAQIGLARSKDGITDWQRHSLNPIIHKGHENEWDADSAYKPFAIFDGTQWMLWYNGRNKSIEQIGLAMHEGRDFGF